MAFFDKLTDVARNVMDKTGDMAKNVADKTGDMVEISKIKMKISEEKGKIAGIKRDLGEYYWRLYESGTTLDEKATSLCDGIKEALQTIDSYTEEIKKIEGKDMQTDSEITKDSPTIEAVSSQPIETEIEPIAYDSTPVPETSMCIDEEKPS